GVENRSDSLLSTVLGENVVLSTAVGSMEQAGKSHSKSVVSFGRALSMRLNALGRGFAAACCLAVLLWVPRASAQDDTFTLDRAQLSGAPDDGFMVYRPYLPEETRVYANGALGFALNTLRDSAFGSGVRFEGGAP